LVLLFGLLPTSLFFAQFLFEIRKQSYKFVSTKKLKSPKKRTSA